MKFSTEKNHRLCQLSSLKIKKHTFWEGSFLQDYKNIRKVNFECYVLSAIPSVFLTNTYDCNALYKNVLSDIH